MIVSPKNFIEQFQNFIEHIAKLMKTFLTKEIADSYYLSKTGKAVNASAADKATRDANGNVITSTYATKTEVTSGLSGKLGKTEKASSAGWADAVAWTGVSGKPNFATVATSGSYNDLSNKPNIPNSTVAQKFNSQISEGTVTISGLTPYKPCFLLLRFYDYNPGIGVGAANLNLIGGAAINGSGSGTTIGATLRASDSGNSSDNAVVTAVVVPVGTTLNFMMASPDGKTQLVAYQ